jgi:hypothetical protein
MDASKGLLRKGMGRAQTQGAETEFPNDGFHDTLLRLATDDGGSTLAGSIKVTLGIVTW